MERLTYNQYKNMPQVFIDMHKENQNFKVIHFLIDASDPDYGKCPSCYKANEWETEYGLVRYCLLGGFTVSRINTCDEYKWEKMGDKE